MTWRRTRARPLLAGDAPAAVHGGGDRLLDGAHLAPGIRGEALQVLGEVLDRVGVATHVAVELLPGERRRHRGAGAGAGGGRGDRGGAAGLAPVGEEGAHPR